MRVKGLYDAGHCSSTVVGLGLIRKEEEGLENILLHNVLRSGLFVRNLSLFSFDNALKNHENDQH